MISTYQKILDAIDEHLAEKDKPTSFIFIGVDNESKTISIIVPENTNQILDAALVDLEIAEQLSQTVMSLFCDLIANKPQAYDYFFRVGMPEVERIRAEKRKDIN